MQYSKYNKNKAPTGLPIYVICLLQSLYIVLLKNILIITTGIEHLFAFSSKFTEFDKDVEILLINRVSSNTSTRYMVLKFNIDD